MPATKIPPPRRSDLLMRPLGDDGQHVVKDLRTGTYFNLPPQEAFLLTQLDGQRCSEDICAAFEKQFGEPLSPADLDEFLEVAHGQKLLAAPPASETPAPEGKKPSSSSSSPLKLARNILYFRHSVFDPDRLFTWLEPKITFFWTAAFFWASIALMGVAALLHWTGWREYAEYLPEAVRWETIVLAWVILFVVTTAHEFAHGLTCKHYGGEVHEVGFLLMFFMPCFYCNVSDAWLIRERSRRVWVTLAGGFCDLGMWAVAVVVWRLTLSGSMPYHVAWLVMSICGGRVILNLNPLVKLDGYYIASDLLEIPNLRKRSLARVAAWLRCLLWGARRPEPEPRSRMLVGFGLISWCFSIFFLGLMFWSLFRLLRSYLGLAGIIPLGVLAWLIIPGLCSGLSEGEIMTMLKTRYFRSAAWIFGLTGVPIVLFLVPMEDFVSGTFKARPSVRVEVRAPVSGFLHVVCVDEGTAVKSGDWLAYLEIPDLQSRIAQKIAEEREADAKLKLLLAGSRPEEVAEQRERVKRARAWVEVADHELSCKKTAHKEELKRLDDAIRQATTQLDFAAGKLERVQRLWDKKVIPLEDYEEARRSHLFAQAQLSQAQAQKRERSALGTVEPEGELARRVKDHADAQAVLALMEAGTRPEQIEAERAHLARVQEERAFLEKMQGRLKVGCPVPGVIVTPRLREKVGQYLKEGELICEIEDPDSIELEVPLDEQDAGRVEVGQRVDLKPRAIPLHTFKGEVERIAPLAVAGKVQSSLMVYCRLDAPAAELKSGMTGYARISTHRGSIGTYFAGRALRYFRTEIWW
jgi:multidrug resistance efflux pump